MENLEKLKESIIKEIKSELQSILAMQKEIFEFIKEEFNKSTVSDNTVRSGIEYIARMVSI